MQIPFLDLRPQHDSIRPELDQAYHKVMDKSWFVLGQAVEEFESAAAQYFGCKYAIGVASGLDALIIAMRCAGIGAGDEVIVPAHTYIATWQAVTMVGAKVVPVPMQYGDFNIDSKVIERYITNKTKAILPVHLYGTPCDMISIMAVAEEYGLKVIEDNSQAQGATWNGKKTGTFGHVNGVSLYPGKNLGALGDAGLILTDIEEYALQSKTLRNYGSSKKYHNELLGYNSRLDEMQAAFLSVKLPHLDRWNNERSAIAIYYQENIIHPSVKLPDYPTEGEGVHHVYPILAAERDELAAYLKEQGIGTMIHYPKAIHLQEAYAHLDIAKGSFLIAEKWADHLLSLPIYPGLKTESLGYIVETINAFSA